MLALPAALLLGSAPIAAAPLLPGASFVAPPQPAPSGASQDIVVTADPERIKQDPLVKINEQSFAAVQAMDRTMVRPMAMAYKHVLPEPVRDGLHNFLENLHQPDVAVNFLLQAKPGKAAETVARFVINSTIGVAGLFDIAKRKPFNLPDRPNSFADTLGYYGVKSGAFFYLPLLGPTTVRDLIGLAIDRALLPTVVGYPFTRPAYNIAAGTLKALDHRVRFDAAYRAQAATGDPYATMRRYYLESRRREIEALHTHHARRRVTVRAAQPYVALVAAPPRMTALALVTGMSVPAR